MKAKPAPKPASRRKKWIIILLIPVLILALAYIFRAQILRFCGLMLISEDPKEICDAIFVLSGDAPDRGRESANLWQEGLAPKVIFTGEEGVYSNDRSDPNFLSMGEHTANEAIKNGLDSTKIGFIDKGTSTWEEFEAIREYAIQYKLKKIMVVTTKIHTRRVRQVFRKRLKKEGIEVIVRGAFESKYPETEWWKTEEGAIAVNNEYVKIVYYWLMH